MVVGEGEGEEGRHHDVWGETRNFEDCWCATEHLSVPCLSGIVLGLNSDLLTVNFVRRLTGVSVTEDHEVGVVVSISWEAGEHPQPAFEHGGVSTRVLWSANCMGSPGTKMDIMGHRRQGQ